MDRVKFETIEDSHELYLKVLGCVNAYQHNKLVAEETLPKRMV